MPEPLKVLPTVSTAELTRIIRRLEAATSRLEDIASSTLEPTKVNGAPPTSAPTGPLPPLPVVNEVPPTPKAVLESLPESVEDFDSFLNGAVKNYVSLSNELGGPVAKQV